MYEGLAVSALQLSEGAGAGKHKMLPEIMPFHGAVPHGNLEHVPWVLGGCRAIRLQLGLTCSSWLLSSHTVRDRLWP